MPLAHSPPGHCGLGCISSCGLGCISSCGSIRDWLSFSAPFFLRALFRPALLARMGRGPSRRPVPGAFGATSVPPPAVLPAVAALPRAAVDAVSLTHGPDSFSLNSSRTLPSARRTIAPVPPTHRSDSHRSAAPGSSTHHRSAVPGSSAHRSAAPDSLTYRSATPASSSTRRSATPDSLARHAVAPASLPGRPIPAPDALAGRPPSLPGRPVAAPDASAGRPVPSPDSVGET